MMILIDATFLAGMNELKIPVWSHPLGLFLEASLDFPDMVVADADGEFFLYVALSPDEDDVPQPTGAPVGVFASLAEVLSYVRSMS